MIFYSNAERGIPIEEGTIFKAECRSVEISVHRKKGCDGWFLDGWFLTCDALGFHDMELESTRAVSAILESKRVIERRMETAKMIVEDFHKHETSMMRG